MPDHEKEHIPRKQTLTEADLETLRDLLTCNKCSFSTEQTDTLRGLAENSTTAQKLSTKIIISGMILGVFSGILFALKHLFFEALKTGGSVLK